MAREFPWYELVEGDTLEQGDLLPECPNVTLPVDVSFPLPKTDLALTATFFDAVVMTHSCDLVQPKADASVLLCAHWDLETVAKTNPSLANKEAATEIKKGRRPRYVLLSASDCKDFTMNPRVVDLGQSWLLPLRLVAQIAGNSRPRLRVLPPYREHLSQAYARYFMRVGLPKEVVL